MHWYWGFVTSLVAAYPAFLLSLFLSTFAASYILWMHPTFLVVVRFATAHTAKVTALALSKCVLSPKSLRHSNLGCAGVAPARQLYMTLFGADHYPPGCCGRVGVNQY
jgi:hypothetical protein